MTSRRAFLTLAAGSGLLALAGCSALSAQGETRQSAPTPTIAPSPAVTAASVAVGSLTGGTTVQVTGSTLTNVVGVTIGATPATSVVSDDSTVSFVTPAAVAYQPSNEPITLVFADGTTADTDKQFTYEAITPVDKQLQYAFTYWQNYNLPDWGVFSDNDCGNFVNQTLVARGWVQSSDWYSDYVTSGDYSLSWIRGTEMDEYLASRSDTTRLELTDRDKLKIGDVVMFDWDPQNDNGPDHTMVISRLDTNADGSIAVKLVGHTIDAQYRDLDTAISVDNPGGTAHFYSIA